MTFLEFVNLPTAYRLEIYEYAKNAALQHFELTLDDFELDDETGYAFADGVEERYMAFLSETR